MWGRDGGDVASDLGGLETDIFLQRGMDRQTTDLPVGQISWNPLPNFAVRAG
jgi:hypothetical protein